MMVYCMSAEFRMLVNIRESIQLTITIPLLFSAMSKAYKD